MKRLIALLIMLTVLLVACEKNGEEEGQSAVSTETNEVHFTDTTTAERAIPTESLPSTLPADEIIGTPNVG